jgi:hypothetical protein
MFGTPSRPSRPPGNFVWTARLPRDVANAVTAAANGQLWRPSLPAVLQPCSYARTAARTSRLARCAAILLTDNLGSGCDDQYHQQQVTSGTGWWPMHWAPTGRRAGGLRRIQQLSDGPSVRIRARALQGCGSDPDLTSRGTSTWATAGVSRIDAFNLFDTVVFTRRPDALPEYPTNPTMRERSIWRTARSTRPAACRMPVRHRECGRLRSLRRRFGSRSSRAEVRYRAAGWGGSPSGFRFCFRRPGLAGDRPGLGTFPALPEP